MDIISNRFLGQVKQRDQTWDIDIGNEIADYILMTMEFVDFDISCHRESSLKLSNEFGEAYAYCNGNRPFGKIRYLAGKYTVTFVSNQLLSALDDLFREGFHLSYRFVPQYETLPNSLHVSSEYFSGTTVKVRVCVGGLHKCFLIQVVRGYSWESVYLMCKEEGMTMVNMKTMDEMVILKSVLLMINRQRNTYNIPKEIFIGLLRYVDSSGAMHEHWSDGSPLSYTAWDEGEPTDMTLKQCTKMDFQRPSVNNTWKTLSCYLKQLEVLAVCEQVDTGYGVSKHKKRHSINLNVENAVFDQRYLSTIFKCLSGEWISSLARCNNIAECLDSSDELNCGNTEDMSCTDDEFKCSDGRCIHISLVCDFKADCVDAADEFCEHPACAEDSCDNGQCIQNHERCNAIQDCLDGSDEANCEACSAVGTFQCLDRSCIPSYLVCDMVHDCDDGADEISCDHNYTTCESLLKNGIRQSGYFQINKEYFIHCDFDNITKGGNWVQMSLPTIDWKQLTSDSLSVSTAGLTIPVENEFHCSQKIGIYPQREEEQGMRLDGKDVPMDNITHTFLPLAKSIRSYYYFERSVSVNYTTVDIRNSKNMKASNA
ncbi:uncharacterized protein LOC132751397 [Ruditapes philippinarum]|uniref:uncharacterized protein LOC132751397 n=1 Tax=Ruditapes philippinarum TaxID=129788 RepID=UPI00295B0C64|nr:uncharacterized protein LOC132751397 [Ruditapes philippinarum]